jgi:hypothetical protein
MTTKGSEHMTKQINRRTVIAGSTALATTLAPLPVLAAETDADAEIVRLYDAYLEAERRDVEAYAAYDQASADARAAKPKPPESILHRAGDVFGYMRDEFGRPAVLTRDAIEAYAAPWRYHNYPEGVAKARRIADERLVTLETWQAECARQDEIHRVAELKDASEAATDARYEAWQALADAPAQSFKGIALKLVALFQWDDGLSDAWSGKCCPELGDTMCLAARADALRLAGMPHTYGTDEPQGEYVDTEETEEEGA